MSAIDFIRPALAWERRKKGAETVLVPNTADTGSESSMRIASELYRILGVPEAASPKANAGKVFEAGVAAFLRHALPRLDDRPWEVAHPGREITHSGQYSQFRRVRDLVQASPELRTAIGLDYLVMPDITIHLPRRFRSAGRRHPNPEAPLLHASVSCKWTLRSDRAQNVRPEAQDLIRRRCGRVPHIVVVTAEPTIGRVESIAKGTGDLDAVYHVALPELEQATRAAGYAAAADRLLELEDQGRLMDLRDLPAVLCDS